MSHQQAPLPYKEISSTVEKFLTRCDHVKGWHLDATEPTTDDKVEYFPFAEQNNVGVHLSYRSSAHNLLAKCAVSVNPSSWLNFLPTLQYKWARDDVAHTVEFACSSTALKYTMSHPAFHAEVRSLLGDGAGGWAGVSTYLTQATLLGAEAHYDPRRSGLKNFTVLALQKGCPSFNRGDILAKYSLLRGFGIHLRVPVSPYLDAAVISEYQRFIVGCQGNSPCGAKMLFNVNVSNATSTITAIRNVQDIWKITLSCTRPLTSSSWVKPSFGVRFTNEDVITD